MLMSDFNELATGGVKIYGESITPTEPTTTTTTTTTTTAGRPTVYWQCSLADVQNLSNPCTFVGQCRYAGNTYLPTGCTSCCD